MDFDFEKGENILHQSRKHWFVFFVEIIGILISTFAPLVLISIFLSLPIDFSQIENYLILVSFFYTLWLFFMWNIAFLIWTDYYLDMLIITNRRIIDIDQKGIFNREISVLRLSKVQDVTAEKNGIIATVLDFGNIHIQTAGQQREFIVKNIANPNKSNDAINDAIDYFRKNEYVVSADIFDN